MAIVWRAWTAARFRWTAAMLASGAPAGFHPIFATSDRDAIPPAG